MTTPITTRAKFRCGSVETYAVPTDGPEGTRAYRFSAVYDDGTPENQRYAKYTPSGELRIVVDNPSVQFEPGRSYYLDITAADAPTEE